MIVRSVFAAAAFLIAALMGSCMFVIARYRIPEQFTVFSMIVSNYGLYLIPLGLAGAGLALLARFRAGRVMRWGGVLIALVCAAGVVAAGFPVVASWQDADRAGATLSVKDYLKGGSNNGKPDERRSVAYNTIDGKDLLLDVKLPPGTPEQPRAAVVWVHGGGFAEGDRGEGPKWHQWLNDRGYAVFAVDYRLSPPPRWNEAPADVKCAVGWVKQHAAAYLVDPERVMVIGGSAGGNLALMAAYAGEQVPPSCPVPDTSVKAVAAFYPAVDLAAMYSDPALVSKVDTLARDYTGGTPGQVPDRYAAASPITYVRQGLPPTLLIHGTRDHVVPYTQSVELVERLKAVGVQYQLQPIPYGEHAFDAGWGDWGTQISRHVLGEFMIKKFPAR
ncbi:alpha/beta hydrolase [Nocardia sp. 2]|uniref:Alpha/beta hydrolase n=1 Tax=Nocardia acididurans TaxID=2802282 RepID=A0ABS1M8U8_9NOCA|nr:alpha/beta hydrolase [Nocardia acididurans]MBL1076716.1 alpha/beta hydrolase [Nocardia acididurans]